MDGETIWIQPPDSADVGEAIAVDSSGTVSERMPLRGGDRLVGETSMGHLTMREMHRQPHDLLLRDRDGSETTLAEAARLHAVIPGLAAWSSHRTPGVMQLLTTDQRLTVRVDRVNEWHNSGSVSPDGRLLAIGAYIDPPRPPKGLLRALNEPLIPRSSVMVLIHTDTGNASVIDGVFPEFAWTPAWSKNGEWVVFSAPFQKRRLYGVQVSTSVSHEWPFRHNPPAPMLDVSGLAEPPFT
jgi:hypothetical protein